MEFLKKYLVCLCIHSAYGAVIVGVDSSDTDVMYKDKYMYSFETQDEDIKSGEIVMPLISNGIIPETLNNNGVTKILLQMVKAIFKATTQLGLEVYGWRLSSGFMASLLAIFFGPNVNLLIPVLTIVGNVILRWLT